MTKRTAEDLVAEWEKTGVATVNLDELKALVAECRELREALTDIGVNAGGEASRRARAALAAEPASGEGRAVQFKSATEQRAYAEAHSDAPPPPPAQGEEETALARTIRDQLCHRDVCQFDLGCGCLDAIKAALRQRADEAMRVENEACAEIAQAYEDGQDKTVRARAIAAAIRARIAPKGEP